MTRSDPRSDFLSGKPLLPLPPSSLSLSLSNPRSSRGFPSDEDECNAVQRDVNSFPVQDVWSSDNGPFPFTRYSAAISDPNCIRETRRSNHRYWLVSEGRVNCTSDVTWPVVGPRYNRSNVNFEPRCVRHSTPFNASSFLRGKWWRASHKIIKITTLEAWITGFERAYYWISRFPFGIVELHWLQRESSCDEFLLREDRVSCCVLRHLGSMGRWRRNTRIRVNNYNPPSSS